MTKFGLLYPRPLPTVPQSSFNQRRTHLDWDRALSRNTLALLGIVGALFALLVSARLDGAGLMIPRPIWCSILHVLRPAEAALLRLIIIAARALVHAPAMLRQPASKVSPTVPQPPANAFAIAPAFQLFDPLKPVHAIFGDEDDEAFDDDFGCSSGACDGDDPVNAEALHNRLRALRLALAELGKQAARLARFNARRDALLNAARPVRTFLMRPGLPPGWRKRGKHEVDTVLKECHQLVRYLEDTS
jgi:hypothetical protein